MGAIGWLTAGGDKQQVSTARDRITTAAIGLVLVIAAYAITGVVGSLFGLDILDLKGTIGKIITQSATAPGGTTPGDGTGAPGGGTPGDGTGAPGGGTPGDGSGAPGGRTPTD